MTASDDPLSTLEQYQAVLEAARCAVLTLDADGYLLAASTSLTTLTGYPVESLIGQSYSELVVEGWRKRLVPLDEALTDAAEYPLHTESGAVCWVRQTLIAQDDGYQCFWQDITGTMEQSHEVLLHSYAVEASPTAILIADMQQPDAPLIYVNPAFEAMTGYSAADVIGRNSRFLQADDRDQGAIRQMADAIQQGEACNVVLRNYRKDGTLFWNEMSLAPVRDADDRVTHYVGIATDITAQKETEEALSQERNLLRTIIDNIPDFISAKDDSGEYILSNPAHARLLGAASPRAVIGKRGEDFLPHELASRFHEEDKEVMQGEMHIINEERHVPGRIDGLEWVSASKVPLHDADGQPVGVVGIARDITKRKQYENELKHREQLYRSLARNLPRAAVFLFDRDMNLLIAEGQELDPEHYPPDRMEGRDFREILDQYTDEPEHLKRIYQRVFDGEETHFENQYRGQYYSIHAIPVRDNEGEIFAGIVLAQNVDEQRRSEEALRQSEQRNRALLNALPDMMFVLTRDGTYTEFHVSPDVLLPLEPSNLVGTNIRDTGLPDTLVDDSLRHMQQTFESGQPQTFEYSLPIQGIDFYYEARMVALNDDEVLALVRDITDMKRIQDELSHHIEDLTVLRQVDTELSENLSMYYVMQLALDALMRLSNAQAGYMALIDTDGQLVPEAVIGAYDVDALQHTLNQKKGVAPYALRTREDIFVADVQQNPHHVSLLPETESVIAMPLISQERPIGVVHLEASQAHRFSLDRFQFLRLVTGRIASILDNARLYQQTEDQLNELQRLYDEVRKLEQLKTDMIRIASHDLKNPLAAIMGYLEMLGWEAEQTMDDEHRGYLNHIRDSARKMQRITSGILSLERIEQMAQQHSRERFDLANLVRKTIREHRADAQSREQTLDVHLPQTRLRLQGDPIQLHEALSNLISNAIKYTPERGEITISLTVENALACVRVQDTGYGIPEAQQKRLFSPFYRARMKETKGIEGTGLGLHLVKNIIERHGGEMYLQSSYGKGSTFGFDLPLPDETRSEGATVVGDLPQTDESSMTQDVDGSTVIY
jgi:PAS domain S-box-containing protein